MGLHSTLHLGKTPFFKLEEFEGVKQRDVSVSTKKKKGWRNYSSAQTVDWSFQIDKKNRYITDWSTLRFIRAERMLLPC